MLRTQVKAAESGMWRAALSGEASNAAIEAAGLWWMQLLAIEVVQHNLRSIIMSICICA
jgi:hypothetical protein